MIVTVQEVERTTGIKGKSERISELIPLVEDWIRGYCQDDFKDANGVDDFPIGYSLIAIKMIEFNLYQKAGYASEGLSRHSVSFATDYPSNITKGLRRKLSW